MWKKVENIWTQSRTHLVIFFCSNNSLGLDSFYSLALRGGLKWRAESVVLIINLLMCRNVWFSSLETQYRRTSCRWFCFIFIKMGGWLENKFFNWFWFYRDGRKSLRRPNQLFEAVFWRLTVKYCERSLFFSGRAISQNWFVANH